MKKIAFTAAAILIGVASSSVAAEYHLEPIVPDVSFDYQALTFGISPFGNPPYGADKNSSILRYPELRSVEVAEHQNEISLDNPSEGGGGLKLNVEYMPIVIRQNGHVVRFGVGLSKFYFSVISGRGTITSPPHNGYSGFTRPMTYQSYVDALNTSALVGYECGKFSVIGKVGGARVLHSLAVQRPNFPNEDYDMKTGGGAIVSWLPSVGIDLGYQVSDRISITCGWDRICPPLGGGSSRATDLFSAGLRFKLL